MFKIRRLFLSFNSHGKRIVTNKTVKLLIIETFLASLYLSKYRCTEVLCIVSIIFVRSAMNMMKNDIEQVEGGIFINCVISLLATLFYTHIAEAYTHSYKKFKPLHL